MSFFIDFAQGAPLQSALRAAITAAYRRPEPECLPFLIDQARLPPEQATQAQALATQLVESLRAKRGSGGVQAFIHEFSLSSQEGVALMCIAEALLRIPDRAMRDALIRDKISQGDWQSRLGQAPSLFVNAAAWGLAITGKLVAANSAAGLSAALMRLISKGGEPLIRKGVDWAMRLMSEQFVCGETISVALANSRRYEALGFRYSYDMLGEAAMTAADAQRYDASYQQAIHLVGQAAGKSGVYAGPGISIKLSALHPRYTRAQRARVMAELLPRVRALARLARRYDIGLNIDAEEADRLDISLDLFEALCFDPALAGWHGLGFVVQAYQKRCLFVIDYLIDLARRSRHRLMVRLVKGAYWDSEIKRAQVDGLEDYPVYTRKLYTDVSYLAGAKKLLAATDAVYPQFATHNAYTLAAIYLMAGQPYTPDQYEFQCLHGMGEPLYEEVTGPQAKLNRPCRIYAPVGTHETLLAYLARRLLENGANTSFLYQIADPKMPVSELVADPVAAAAAIAPLGAPHSKIPLPIQLYGAQRANSKGIDFSNEQQLASLASALLANSHHSWRAAPMLADRECDGAARPVRNPADHRDLLGSVVDADAAQVSAAFANALAAAPSWRATPVKQRADCLRRAADQFEAQLPILIGLIVREAGKSLPNAVAEIREAADFLRYYAAQVCADWSDGPLHSYRPLGPIVCISPWNFPLAIFIGQIAAALAAGNPVLAKPAEQTPLIAAQAVRVLREAGVPAGAVQLLPGSGETVGAALVADPRACAVMFTGSIEVARLINAALASRLSPHGKPIPLIAETGGQNVMIVDSSALAEQVVADVWQSAFDSAGQRCSALRVLCLQEEVAERILTMLKGAMHEWVVGPPDRLSTDIGPVIDADAQRMIESHISTMRAKGYPVYRLSLPNRCRHGTFVAPTLIEIESLNDLNREVFGPVLHVLRYHHRAFDSLLEAIRATGYGLTMGVHTRLDETVKRVIDSAQVGNLYVNRNMIGAVVGVQPFGGERLSGTGPKAGGPLSLSCLLATPLPLPARYAKLLSDDKSGATVTGQAKAALAAYRAWCLAHGYTHTAERCRRYLDKVLVGTTAILSGPTGERNTYSLHARGTVLCVASTAGGARAQFAAALATGNRALFASPTGTADPAEPITAAFTGLSHSHAGGVAPPRRTCVLSSSSRLASVAGRESCFISELPAVLQSHVALAQDDSVAFDAVLFEGEREALCALIKRVAAQRGAIITVQSVAAGALEADDDGYLLERLLTERSVSINTAAAGGNASLMTIG